EYSDSRRSGIFFLLVEFDLACSQCIVLVGSVVAYLYLPGKLLDPSQTELQLLPIVRALLYREWHNHRIEIPGANNNLLTMRVAFDQTCMNTRLTQRYSGRRRYIWFCRHQAYSFLNSITLRVNERQLALRLSTNCVDRVRFSELQPFVFQRWQELNLRPSRQAGT